MQDGCYSVFLSTYGKNRDEVPEELVKFLAFVKADGTASRQDFSDDFVKSLPGIHRTHQREQKDGGEIYAVRRINRG